MTYCREGVNMRNDHYETLVRYADSGPVRAYRYHKCRECGRRFDLTDETDLAEWEFGHDCEA